MIVTFSGTGNSRYCAQLLADRMGEQWMDAFPYIRDGTAAVLQTIRPWVFVTPTYGWRIPRIFAQFLRTARLQGCQDAYFVMTCGSEIGDAGRHLRLLCKEIGLRYRGVLEVVMPENYVAMFPVPQAAEAERIVDAAEPVLEAGADCIRRGQPFPPHSAGLLDRLKSGVVNSMYYATIVKAKAFHTTDACTGCGKCVRGCPLKNVSLENGRPQWGDACTHCMACICGCPAQAVEYGRRSRGKPRYQCRVYSGKRQR